MQTSDTGKALIKQFEDCKLQSYPDPKTGGDPWTIGWGETGPGINEGLAWSQAYADQRFESSVALREKDLIGLLDGAPTTQGQFDALLSFGYNVGMYGSVAHPKLRESTLLRYHKLGRYAEAAGEFAKWINKGSSVEKGLRRRRAAEMELYQS